MWAVVFILFVAEVARPEGLTQDENQIKSVALATINSYDIDKSYYENFFSILYAMCPSAVHCDGRNATDLNFEHPVELFNDTFDLSKGMMQEKNATLIEEARHYLESIFSNTKCCKKCSCKDYCTITNTCCPLKDADETLDIHRSMREAQRCIYPSVYTQTPWILESIGKSFYMISHCLNESIDNDVIRKCQNPRIEFVSEMIPVYSKTTNILYRNKYCAVCNDELTWISWQLRAYFSDSVTLTGLERDLNSNGVNYNNLRRNWHEIKLLVEPTDEFLKVKDEFICTPPAYVKAVCPELNGLNEDQNYFLQFACSYHQSLFYETYRNVFCYICYKMVIGKFPNCRESDTDIRGISSSFSGILYNGRAVENEKVLATKNNCTCREYYDKTQDTCRPVICPVGKTYFSCSCENVLENITSLGVRIVLDIVPETPSINVVKLMNETTTDKLVRQVKTIVNSVFKTKWGSMEIRLLFMNRETLLSDRSHIKFHATLFMRSKRTTDNLVLLKDVHDLLYSKIRITFLKTPMLMYLGKIIKAYYNSDQSFPLDYESAYSTDFSFEPLYSIERSVLTYYEIYATIYLTKLLFCKRIILNDEEVGSLSNSSISVGYSEEEISQMFDASEQQVCLDDYVIIFTMPTSKACGYGPNQQIVVYVVVWLSSLLIYI